MRQEPSASVPAGLDEAVREAVGMDKICRTMIRCLERDEVFLDAGLTLGKLSSLVGTNTAYLSRVVNQHYGMNFKSVLNAYRVEYAIRLAAREGESFENIALKCGFTSRSVFYVAFKKQTGLTPRKHQKLAESGYKDFERFKPCTTHEPEVPAMPDMKKFE